MDETTKSSGKSHCQDIVTAFFFFPLCFPWVRFLPWIDHETKFMGRFYLIVSLILCVLFTQAQQGGFRARICPPGSADNSTRAIFEIPGNKFIALGFLEDTINGVPHHRLAIMVLDGSGQMLWIKKYGDDDFFYYSNNFIRRTCYKQGNFLYYAGCAKDSTNKQIGVLMKFDLSGDTIWQRIYRDPDPLEDVIPQMVTGSIDGGFLITGFFQNWGINYSRCLLIKTDAHGNELWRKKIGKSAPDVQDGKAIIQDSASKRIVVVGYLYQSNRHYDNVLILDSLGNKISQASYNGWGGSLVDLIQTKDKNFVSVGTSFYKNPNGGDDLSRSFIIKIDLNSPLLQPVWKVTNIDPLVLYNCFTSVTELPNGNLLAGGVLDTAGMMNQMDNFLTKWFWIDPSGKVVRKKYCDYKNNTVGEDNHHSLNSVALTTGGGWIAAIEQLNTAKPNPFFFVKYDSTGCDSTLNYCSAINNVGIQNFSVENDHFKIYPNPTKDFLELEISSALAKMELSYTIYNCFGSLTLEDKITLHDKTSFDVSRFDPGIYNLVLKGPEGYSVTKKFVVAR